MQACLTPPVALPDEVRPHSLPCCRTDLVIRQTGENEYVVKLPKDGKYFRIGPTEQFLLSRLNGQFSATEICEAFEGKFAEPLAVDELDDFISSVSSLGLFQSAEKATKDLPNEQGSTTVTLDDDEDEEYGKKSRGSLLFYRRTLFDPNNLLNWLEPRLRFLWTKAFFLASAFTIGWAASIVWNYRSDLVSSFPQMMRWESLILFWVTMVTVTMIHEFAHGLTCKHYGGDVHEIGVLFVFMTPCFYCNVSDAWLIPKKSHRLWVTLAGGYCDLCFWAVAVLVWRVTVEESLINYLAWIVLSICGGRILFNFNPLLRLDGYYILADLLEVPNLRTRSTERWMAHLRWLLWGAKKPPPARYGHILVIYGGLVWFFALFFLAFVIKQIFGILGGQIGIAGMIITSALLTIAIRRVFRGFLESEFRKMLINRPYRTTAWVTALVVAVAMLFIIPMPYIANGEFNVRAARITEVHAPVAAFVKRVHRSEGDRVEAGTLLVELDLNDLTSQITRKEAEVREVEATLKRLRTGPRQEEVREQQARVARAEQWRDMGLRDLEKMKIVLEQEIVRLDHQVQQSLTEVNYSINSVNRASKLYKVGAIAGEQYRNEFRKYELSSSQLAQAKAARLARQEEGVRSAEAEAARREKELEDAKATLSLMSAGSRPEEIEAETAKLHRQAEELRFLKGQQDKLQVRSPSEGVVGTPRMYERVGQLAELGSLVCVVEDVSTVNVEIAIPEEDVVGIQPGQSIELKARALPFDTFKAKVDRIAPRATGSADKKQSQNSVIVYCSVENGDGKLKSGMTGQARINRGRRTIGLNTLNKGLRYLRTEFWW